jgi:hypothetical protein
MPNPIFTIILPIPINPAFRIKKEKKSTPLTVKNS